jgi:hypothetical protein
MCSEWGGLPGTVLKSDTAVLKGPNVTMLWRWLPLLLQLPQQQRAPAQVGHAARLGWRCRRGGLAQAGCKQGNH